MKRISRREFGALVAAGVVGGRLVPSALAQDGAAVTAGEVVERIRRSIGVEWKARTADTVKAGDPSTVVTGVATTAMATLGVLRQAVEAGANLVVSCEPTFYGRADARTPPPLSGPPGAAPPPSLPDPVYEAKNRFIDENRIVVFRLSDHWRLRTPDPFAQGLGEAMGWSPMPDDPTRYDVPSTTLEGLAGELKRRLQARGGIRVVGDPRSAVRRVALLPGSTPIADSLRALPGADVVVAGEVREWESVEYARDVASSGQPKGLILLGRVLSEEPGMAVCARWLAGLVPEVAVRHLPAGDPYWSAAS